MKLEIIPLLLIVILILSLLNGYFFYKAYEERKFLFNRQEKNITKIEKIYTDYVSKKDLDSILEKIKNNYEK